MKKIILINIIIFQTITCFAQTSMANAPKKDSLFAKRGFLNTKIYKNSVLLSNDFIKKTLIIDSQASKKYKWGKILNPIAPVFTIGGVALMAVGLTGKQEFIDIDGKPYEYTNRSLTKTLGGLAIAALGLCLLESSNELMQHSVDIYNKSITQPKKKVSVIYGITPAGNVGLVMNF